MQLRPLRSADEFNRYGNFAHEVYRRSPHWVSKRFSGPAAPAAERRRSTTSDSQRS